MELIDATPRNILPLGRNQWMFEYGEPEIGREVGAAYLIPGNPHYTRFKIVASPQPEGSDQPPIPAYQLISERPLTPEEIPHFEALAKSVGA